MEPFLEKTHDFYAMKPGAGILQHEFGFYSLEAWEEAGFLRPGDKPEEVFGLEPSGVYALGGLGWCEAALSPAFEEKVLEDRGAYELVQDFAGRKLLCFKGRRSGFMPEYVGHPVTDMASWEENVLWRMDPADPARAEDGKKAGLEAIEKQAAGYHVTQQLVGGYMYLRSLIGPEELLYAFYDQPELIHACMEGWLTLADSVIARHQSYVTLDEVFLAEDISYNHGPLISPDMMREFLLPYYSRLLDNIRKRQKDDRRFHLQIDTDGHCLPTIPLYREIGMTYMSPFEVAAGCDVVRVAEEYPDLLIRGGIDKRILASGRDAILAEVRRILPVMKARGGYIPECDHGVPAEVPFEDYVYYRQLIREYSE